MDIQTLGIVVAVVVVTAVVLYVYDRRSKHLAVDVLDAAKLGLGAGAIAGGVTYAVGGEAIADAVETVAAAAPDAQEMFIGKPEF